MGDAGFQVSPCDVPVPDLSVIAQVAFNDIDSALVGRHDDKRVLA